MENKNFNNSNIRIRQVKKKCKDEPNQLVLSNRFRLDSIFTTQSEHVFSTNCEKNGTTQQEFTRELYTIPENDLANIDERGIIKLGTFVEPGDILVCKGTKNDNNNDNSLEAMLLRAFFQDDNVTHYKDISLRVPYNVSGKITDIRITNKKRKDSTIITDLIESVSVTILQKHPIEVGDILIDEYGNEGIVVAFDLNNTNYEITSNFQFGINIRKKSIAEESIQARSSGPYSLFEYPIANYNHYDNIYYPVSKIPQKLSFVDIMKFLNNGFGDVLKNIISFQSNEPLNRSILNKWAIKNDPPTSTDCFYLPMYNINEFCCLLYAICLKPVFRDINKNEVFYSFGDDNSQLVTAYLGQLSLEITELSDNEILNMSYGEVLNSETLSYRTKIPESNGLFCEKIFGPIKNFECSCGKYKSIRYNGVICDKCGIEITNSSVRYKRFGHITLAEPIPHPLNTKRLISVLPILPPALRPIISLNDKKIASSDINHLYKQIIDCNNQLKYLKRNRAAEDLIKYKKKLLQKNVQNLFNNAHCEHKETRTYNHLLESLLERIKKHLTKHLDHVPLDYSAACNVIIDNSLPDNSCGLPFEIAIELFKPFLIKKLYETGISKNFRQAQQLIDKSKKQKSEQKETIISLLKTIMQSKKILVFSKDASGEILVLSPMPILSKVLSINLSQYSRLKAKIDESIKIILPASNAAQNMLQHKCLLSNDTMINDMDHDSDFIKELALISLDKNIDIAPALSQSVQNHRICNFNTSISQYVFNKPSEQACNFYKKVQTENEINYPPKTTTKDTENLFRPNNAGAKSDDDEISNIFDDIDQFDDDKRFSFKSGDLFDDSENDNKGLIK